MSAEGWIVGDRPPTITDTIICAARAHLDASAERARAETAVHDARAREDATLRAMLALGADAGIDNIRPGYRWPDVDAYVRRVSP